MLSSYTLSLMALLALTPLHPADVVPHNQDGPPGPALSPAEAVAKMTLPPGFRVEVFAAEPDIVNPVTMNFDERGRVWIAESIEYPRRDAGPGRDRIKVIEDTDGDGKADSFTVFADGLNIPCGVAVGNGGVYVTNSPDILFLRDTDGDDKADTREVILTGFGRADTHELPNTLTWGPDGWLYGLNGVFNGARVVHRGEEHRFDAALWRYHPRTGDFELFAQGTSNPWGLAFDGHGSAFVSACVIDHLYHLAETGYYHRQAGAYPPFTWKIESVVDHKHQKAAYCSLALYDAEVYPREYRGRLFMGNIHGNCINADRLSRKGSTYVSSGEPDLLTANDTWFMPTAIRLGPDGCFYVLDWYDRYHCYQDANRDPRGIDRLKGRLYRIAYGDAPRAGRFNLAAEPTAKLLDRLADSNLWWRSEAQRLLAERIARQNDQETANSLKSLVLLDAFPRNARLHALWALASAEDPGAEPRFLDASFHKRLLSHADPVFRAWGVRAAGNSRRVGPEVRSRIAEMASDLSPEVVLQAATAARKLFDGEEALAVLLQALAAGKTDELIPRIVWRNLEPLVGERAAAIAAWIGSEPRRRLPSIEPIFDRTIERLLATRDRGAGAIDQLVALGIEHRESCPGAAEKGLRALVRATESGQIEPKDLERLRRRLAAPLADIVRAPGAGAVAEEALSLAIAWGDGEAVAQANRMLLEGRREDSRVRARVLQALAATRGPSVADTIKNLLARDDESEEWMREVLRVAGRVDSPALGEAVLGSIEKLPATLRPQALDVLTQRRAWAAQLLDAVDAKKVDRSALNVNQVRQILALDSKELRERVTKVWGQVRTERSPEREKVIARMRNVLKEKPGDPWKGKAAFEKTCLQCHTIFGKGNAVGPDVTFNGRETLDAILTNLLDPNLVIGKDYYAWTLIEKSGRILNGLLVENSDQRAVLKVAGGKEEAVAKKDVRTLEMAEVSLMPEDLEKTISEDEFRDLVAFLRYEEAPPEPVETAKHPGTPRRMAVEQEYGVLRVVADGQELLRHHHSGDGRPFSHPLRAPGMLPEGGFVLTALRPDDHPWQYGLFTGHARAGGLDFWHEKGWIRSRGLERVEEHADRVLLISRADWLSQRQAGKRLLAERQVITVHAPQAADRYRIDFEWRLTPDAELKFERYEYGGLAFRPADHNDRRHERAAGGENRAWQDVSGLFADAGGGVRAAGVAILDHPKNPGFPNRWRVDDQGLINPAITAAGPLTLPAGEEAVFRYRLVIHLGHGDAEVLDEEHRIWTQAASK